jgi:hypothetical protein
MINPKNYPRFVHAGTQPDLSPDAASIFDAVTEQLQLSEEHGGPEGENYAALMRAIIAEAQERLDAYETAGLTDRVGYVVHLKNGARTPRWLAMCSQAVSDSPTVLHVTIRISQQRELEAKLEKDPNVISFKEEW